VFDEQDNCLFLRRNFAAECFLHQTKTVAEHELFRHCGACVDVFILIIISCRAVKCDVNIVS